MPNWPGRRVHCERARQGVWPEGLSGFGVFTAGNTWRFMGSYKWGYKSSNMGFYITTCNYP